MGPILKLQYLQTVFDKIYGCISDVFSNDLRADEDFPSIPDEF